MIRKQKLNEAAGVPNFIFDSSVNIYQEILNEIKTDTDEEDQKFFEIDIDFKIADLKFDKVNFTLKFIEYDEDEYQWIRMAITNKSQLNSEFFFEHQIIEGEIDLILDIAVPNNWEYQKFIELFINHRKKMIESISHELMHVYENRKKGIQDTRDLAEYVAAGKVRTGIMPLDQFSHFLYYITMIENIVRPSEVHTYLKLNQANRKSFMELLKDNDTYKKLVEIRNFSYQGLRKQLLGLIPEIENFFNEAGVENDEYENLDDEGKVNMFLQIYYNSLTHAKANTLYEMLTTNFLEAISGFIGDKDIFFRKFLKRISRFESFEEFFLYEESKFKFVADKMIKKISKVYSLLDEEKINHIQESIINWDLYHKINKTQEKLLNELKRRTINHKKFINVR
jgi:hypothetical protein